MSGGNELDPTTLRFAAGLLFFNKFTIIVSFGVTGHIKAALWVVLALTVIQFELLFIARLRSKPSEVEL